MTPNVPEAEVLAGITISNPDDMEEAARHIVNRGASAVLVKGGHLQTGPVIDLLWDGARVIHWSATRIETRHTHGTGCTLSAAVAAGLASGVPLERAVEAALEFTREAIGSAPGLGAGHGPLNHWVEPGQLPHGSPRRGGAGETEGERAP